MPEGDTVWRTARTLDRALSGEVLVRADLRVPALATVDLVGRTVDQTLARGKHLLTRLGDATLHTHLKMEGSWHVHRPGDRWRRPAHQARVVLSTREWEAVGFSLGVVELLDRDREGDAVGHLGPDLLGPDWDAEEALRRLRRDPGRPVIDALLDQRNLAGVGNMYAAELCFLHGVPPDLPVGQVPDLSGLIAKAQRVLTLGAQGTSQSTTGSTRRGDTHWVYRRERQGCRRCGSPVAVAQRTVTSSVEDGPQSAVRAARERASYWCPRCQATPTGR